MTTKQELHRAIDELSDEEVKKVIRIVEVIQADHTIAPHMIDLARYSGVIQLTEDPLAYRERMRNE